jgi:hypothetical protein
MTKPKASGISFNSNVCCSSTGGDFDQALARGVPGAAGIRFRVNQPAFQYISSLLGGQIGTQIRQARIPSISQCIPKVFNNFFFLCLTLCLARNNQHRE